MFYSVSFKFHSGQFYWLMRRDARHVAHMSAQARMHSPTHARAHAHAHDDAPWHAQWPEKWLQSTLRALA